MTADGTTGPGKRPPARLAIRRGRPALLACSQACAKRLGFNYSLELKSTELWQLQIEEIQAPPPPKGQLCLKCQSKIKLRMAGRFEIAPPTIGCPECAKLRPIGCPECAKLTPGGVRALLPRGTLAALRDPTLHDHDFERRFRHEDTLERLRRALKLKVSKPRPAPEPPALAGTAILALCLDHAPRRGWHADSLSAEEISRTGRALKNAASLLRKALLATASLPRRFPNDPEQRNIQGTTDSEGKEVKLRIIHAKNMKILPPSSPALQIDARFPLLGPFATRRLWEATGDGSEPGLLETFADELNARATELVNPCNRPPNVAAQHFARAWEELVKPTRKPLHDLGAWFSYVTFGERTTRGAFQMRLQT